MASAAFEHVCEGLERRTGLDRLQCRGTVRLILKEAGLDPARVQPREMMVAVQRVLPEALRSRAVERPEAICDEIARGLAGVASTPQHESPDAIFERLGG